MANNNKASKALALADKSAVDPVLDSHLRAQSIVEAINANLPGGVRKLEPIPANYVLRRKDKEVVSVAFHAAFELTGGVPGLVAWARDNPTPFYTLYAKLLPSNVETPVAPTTINFVTSVPRSKLDNVTVDEAGNVADIEFDDEIPE